MKLKNGDILVIDDNRCAYCNENVPQTAYTKSHADVVYYNFDTKDYVDNATKKEAAKLLKNGYDEIDNSIFPCIKKLNDKGYKTDFCCGGHFCTLPLFYEDKVISEMVKPYKKNDLLYFFNYISIDDIYISFKFKGMDTKTRSKAVSNLATFIANNDHLSFEKRVSSYLYHDNDEEGNEILVKERGDIMYKLFADFYDEEVHLRQQEFEMIMESRMSKMNKINIANVVRKVLEPIRDQFDVWKLGVCIYLDYMANTIEPLE